MPFPKPAGAGPVASLHFHDLVTGAKKLPTFYCFLEVISVSLRVPINIKKNQIWHISSHSVHSTISLTQATKSLPTEFYKQLHSFLCHSLSAATMNFLELKPDQDTPDLKV